MDDVSLNTSLTSGRSTPKEEEKKEYEPESDAEIIE